MTRSFHTTRWSVIVAAQGEATEARAALDELCSAYWYPMYAYLRRSGTRHDDALDAVQSFCVDLLEGRARLAADPERGRFRTYLLGALRHFVRAGDRQRRAQKRGGGALLVSLAAGDAEARYGHEPVDATTPERLFERRYALALLQQALARLEAEYVAGGRGRMFATLRPVLVGDDAPPYAALAQELGSTEGAVKVSVHRLRARLRETLRAEVAQTLTHRDDVEDELRHLLAALGP